MQLLRWLFLVSLCCAPLVSADTEIITFKADDPDLPALSSKNTSDM